MSSKEDPEFNSLTQRWNYEDESGQLYEKHPVTNAWVPVIDEDQIKAQQAAYSVPGVDEEVPVEPPTRKRKAQEIFTSAPEVQDTAGDGKDDSKKKKGDRAVPKSKDTSVYVQNLPPDCTQEELATVFSKCGLILEDSVTGRPRIKIYRDAEGRQKGDALVVYFREESVSLAIQMLDDTSLRGDAHMIKVMKASFEYKKAKTTTTESEKPAAVDEAVKKKGVKRAAKLKRKLADWDDEDVKEVPQVNKFDKIVILKGMFSLHELESDPTLLLDLKEDVREECSRLGEVTNVVLYDKEVDGIMSVRFKEAEDAQACIKVMNGRFFGGRQIVAELFDGQRRYTKTGRHTDDAEDAKDGGEDERLAKFGSWLEEGGE